MTVIQDLRNSFERKKGKRDQIEQTIANLTKSIATTEKSIRRHEEARTILQEVGLETQKQLQYHIGDITSLALEAVFHNPYKLIAEFVERRNKTECDLYFSRDGYKLNPLSASGGGAVDIAAFALRIASWSMIYPRLQNTIILDEPFKNLSIDKQDQASKMLKEISNRLDLQFIIITHETTLANYADKTFEIRIKKGISEVKTS